MGTAKKTYTRTIQIRRDHRLQFFTAVSIDDKKALSIGTQQQKQHTRTSWTLSMINGRVSHSWKVRHIESTWIRYSRFSDDFQMMKVSSYATEYTGPLPSNLDSDRISQD